MGNQGVGFRPRLMGGPAGLAPGGPDVLDALGVRPALRRGRVGADLGAEAQQRLARRAVRAERRLPTGFLWIKTAP